MSMGIDLAIKKIPHDVSPTYLYYARQRSSRTTISYRSNRIPHRILINNNLLNNGDERTKTRERKAEKTDREESSKLVEDQSTDEEDP